VVAAAAALVVADAVDYPRQTYPSYEKLYPAPAPKSSIFGTRYILE